jgi:hypothetical protein
LITCPICGKTSHNPNDESQRYCANCHSFYNEIGRELRISELEPGTVVVIMKEGRKSAMTAWVKDIGDVGVMMWCGEIRVNAIFYRKGDELWDDEARLHVFQYLGGDAPTSGTAKA